MKPIHKEDLVVQLVEDMRLDSDLTFTKALEHRGWTAEAIKLALDEDRPSSITKQVKELNQVINGQEQL